MRSFTDCVGRVWSVSVTVDAVRRVRALLGVDLLTLAGGDLLERFLRDPVLICDVLYAVCQPEASTRNVSDEDFGRAMAGDAIDRGLKVLLEEVVDFFPHQQQRQNLRRVLMLAQEAADQIQSRISEQIQLLSADRIIAKSLPNAGPLSGDAPA